MNYPLLLVLVGASVLLMLLEWRGLPMTLELSFKGDVKRETRWLAQYGQSVCTPVAALLVWQLDRRHALYGLGVLAAVGAASLLTMLLKRGLGRVRPGREGAGRFLGPTWRHANWRESFPSSHSACAVALTVSLSLLYPPAAPTFWVLAVLCAGLRYIMDAHWPSDVLAGMALGYVVAHATWLLLRPLAPLNP